MVFSSYFFIFWFLPIFLLGYYLAPPRHRALGLTIASYLFYGWWRPEYCILLAGVTWASYYCGHRISQSDDPRSRKRWLVLSLIVTLGALGFFKYAGMLSVWADSIARLLLSTDGPAVPVFDIILPIGISFFTFQAISYTVDLYRGDAEEAPDRRPTFRRLFGPKRSPDRWPTGAAARSIRMSRTSYRVGEDRGGPASVGRSCRRRACRRR